MNKLFIKFIRLYQKYLSPHKGFKCAYAHVHGGPSYSNAVIQILKEHDFFESRKLIQARFEACSLASRKKSKKRRKKKEEQKWYDACDCSGCFDIGGCLPRCKKADFELPDVGCDVPCDCSL